MLVQQFKVCPRCSVRVPMDDPQCPQCGYVFGTGLNPNVPYGVPVAPEPSALQRFFRNPNVALVCGILGAVTIVIVPLSIAAIWIGINALKHDTDDRNTAVGAIWCGAISLALLASWAAYAWGFKSS